MFKRAGVPVAILVASTFVGSARAGSGSPKPVVAVFEIEDATRKLKKRDVRGLTDYLSTLLAQTGRFQTVPDGQIREALQTQKAESRSACFDEACQIEIGKAVAADTTLSTKIIAVGRECIVAARLYDLRLEASRGAASHRGGCGVSDLASSIERCARRLAGDDSGDDVGNQARARRESPPLADQDLTERPAAWRPSGTQRRVIVEFVSEPVGATVLLDGEVLCEDTSAGCSRAIPAGRYQVTMQKDRYEARSAKVRITKERRIKWSLSPNFGWITVSSVPSDLPVEVDGEVIGSTPLERYELSSGRHEVYVAGSCHARAGRRISVVRGRTKTVKLRPRPLAAAIDVSAEDHKGNALRAEAWVDGKRVGKAPGVLKVSACARELELRHRKHGTWTTSLELKPQATTRVRATIGQPPYCAEDVLRSIKDSGFRATMKSLKLPLMGIATAMLESNHGDVGTGSENYNLAKTSFFSLPGSWAFKKDPTAARAMTAVVHANRDVLLQFVKSSATSKVRRKNAVVKLARFARGCGFDAKAHVVLAAFEKGLSKYRAIQHQPRLSGCRRVCDPRQDPNWGFSSSDIVKECFTGCSGKSGYTSLPTVVRFIHRRVLEGISTDEMQGLVNVARRHLAPRGRGPRRDPERAPRASESGISGSGNKGGGGLALSPLASRAPTRRPRSCAKDALRSAAKSGDFVTMRTQKLSLDELVAVMIDGSYDRMVRRKYSWKVSFPRPASAWQHKKRPAEAQAITSVARANLDVLFGFLGRNRTSKARRRRAVLGLASFAGKCGMGAKALGLLDVFDKGLAAYRSPSNQTKLRSCRRVCDERQDPKWSASGRAEPYWKCFEGCDKKSGYPSLPRIVQFIHRRVLEGISVNEMQGLVNVARRQLKSGRR